MQLNTTILPQNDDRDQESNPNTMNESEVDSVFQELFNSSIDMVDKDSFLHGYSLIMSVKSNEAERGIDSTVVYTRVVKDIFHLMDMIKPYKKHTLYKEFTQRFSESLFVFDEEDKMTVTEALRRNSLSWDEKMKYDRTWILKRVRRKVPSPKDLLPVLKSLFLSFGPLKCSKSARTLFDKIAWKQALSVLKTVELGHASDPPGVQMYFKTGKKDKFGLQLYRCIRGTNSLEGGVHQNLIRKFGSFGAGPKLADAMLTE